MFVRCTSFIPFRFVSVSLFFATHTVWSGCMCCVFFFQAEDGIRDRNVTGVQTCALPIYRINRIFFILEFVGAVSAEDEFELEKNGIGVAAGEEIVLLQEIMVVLQPDLRELSWVPGQVRRNARARLARLVLGETGFLHVEIIAADADNPTFLESPEDLRIQTPVVERFVDREQIVETA